MLSWRTLAAPVAAVILALVLALAVRQNIALRADVRAAKAEAVQARKDLSRVQATLVAREAQRRRTEAAAASARRSLDTALAAESAWASTPVPQVVQDDLCQTLRCAPGATAGGVPSAPANDRP